MKLIPINRNSYMQFVISPGDVYAAATSSAGGNVILYLSIQAIELVYNLATKRPWWLRLYLVFNDYYICKNAMEMLGTSYRIRIYRNPIHISVGCQWITLDTLKEVIDEYYNQLNNKV